VIESAQLISTRRSAGFEKTAANASIASRSRSRTQAQSQGLLSFQSERGKILVTTTVWWDVIVPP
jgi:hypothetical protein